MWRTIAQRVAQSLTPNRTRSNTTAVRAAITGVLGSSQSCSISEPLMQYDMPEKKPLVPLSISMLTTNNINVPAVRLLQDLDWDSIMQSPYAQDQALIAEEIKGQFEQVQRWADRNLMLSPDLALSIVKKFVNWQEFEALHAVLAVEPQAKQSIDEGISVIQGDMGRLDDVFSQAKLLLASDAAAATALFQRSRNTMEKIGSVLDELFDVLKRLQAEEKARRTRYILTGVGCVTIIVAAEFMQYLPNSLGGIVEGCVSGMRDMAGVVATLSLSYALYDWLSSSECDQYLSKLRALRQARNFQHYKLERLIDDSVDMAC
jgi:hypothetical protein